jgi:hypothetical protein
MQCHVGKGRQVRIQGTQVADALTPTHAGGAQWQQGMFSAHTTAMPAMSPEPLVLSEVIQVIHDDAIERPAGFLVTCIVPACLELVSAG